MEGGGGRGGQDSRINVYVLRVQSAANQTAPPYVLIPYKQSLLPAPPKRIQAPWAHKCSRIRATHQAHAVPSCPNAAPLPAGHCQATSSCTWNLVMHPWLDGEGCF